jgi:hypothetical protein
MAKPKQPSKVQPYTTEPEPGLKVRHDGLYQHVIEDSRPEVTISTEELLDRAMQQQTAFLSNLDAMERYVVEFLEEHIVEVKDHRQPPYAKLPVQCVPGKGFQVRPEAPPAAITAVNLWSDIHAIKAHMASTKPDMQWLVSKALTAGMKYERMRVQQIEVIALPFRHKQRRERKKNAKRTKALSPRNRKIVAAFERELNQQKLRRQRLNKKNAYAAIAPEFKLSIEQIKKICNAK